MSPILGGAATRERVPLSAADAVPVARHERDLAALNASRAPAAIAARAFLLALMSPDTTTAELEERARAAYDSIGALWEHAARLTE